MSKQTIILASHGTTSAQAAEKAAIAAAKHTQSKIVHLYVVPDFWRGMRGDDWLNNASTQKRFGDYIEDELAKEAKQQVERLTALAEESGVAITTRAMFGKPADCLIKLCQEENPTRIFIGTPRPKGEQGYNSRMKLEQVVRALTCPMTIVPR